MNANQKKHLFDFDVLEVFRGKTMVLLTQLSESSELHELHDKISKLSELSKFNEN